MHKPTFFPISASRRDNFSCRFMEISKRTLPFLAFSFSLINPLSCIPTTSEKSDVSVFAQHYGVWLLKSYVLMCESLSMDLCEVCPTQYFVPIFCDLDVWSHPKIMIPLRKYNHFILWEVSVAPNSWKNNYFFLNSWGNPFLFLEKLCRCRRVEH